MVHTWFIAACLCLSFDGVSGPAYYNGTMSLPHMHILPRERITRTLAEAVAVYPLTILTAPMGYGKSTAGQALARALTSGPKDALPDHAASQPWRVFTLTVSAGVSAPAHIWDRLCSQLSAQGGGAGEALRRMGFPVDGGAVQRLLDFLLECLAAQGVLPDGPAVPGAAPRRHTNNIFSAFQPIPAIRTLVILDDWHFADAPELDSLLELLVREELPGLSVLLLSRVRPSLPLEEMAVKGLAHEFGQELSAFSETDAVKLFRLHGLKGPEHERLARKAARLCEGWPAAVWLWLHSLAETGETPGEDAPSNLEALLASTVYARYTDTDKELLLRLSVLDGFTVEQAEFFCAPGTGEDVSRPVRLAPRERLPALRDGNAFIARDSGGVYRLHALLRSFLTKRLTLAPDPPFGIDLTALRRRGGELHLAEGDSVRAIHAFRLAGREEDLLRILDIYERTGEEPALILDPRGVSEAVLSLPLPIRHARPRGWLCFIYHVITGVDPAMGAALLAEAEADFLVPDAFEPSLRDIVAGELALVRSFLAWGDLPAMVEGHKAARALLSDASRIAHREQPWLISCPHAGFIYHRKPGAYKAVTALCEDALPRWISLSGGCGAGGGKLMLAERLLEQGRPDLASAFIPPAEREATAMEQTSVLLALAFARARMTLILERDDDPAPRLPGLSEQSDDPLAPLDTLASDPHVSGHPLFPVALDITRGYILALTGRMRQMPAWLLKGAFDPALAFYQGMGMEYVAHGKALLALGKYRQLDEFSACMLERFSPGNELFGLIHARCLRSAALAALHGPERGLPDLKTALKLARPDGILLPQAEYGRYLTGMLELLSCKGVNTGPARRQLAALTVLTQTAAHRQAMFGETRGKSGNLVPAPRSRSGLTPQMKQALELAAQGMTNAEIARSLERTPVTAARLLSAVYRILGVKNRIEAVRLWSMSAKKP